MNTHSPDFVTVDMRGLKAALVGHAQARRESVSVLVRRAVVRELGLDTVRPATDVEPLAVFRRTLVTLSIRLTTVEAKRLAESARQAGLSHGAYLAGLVAGIPVLTSGASRTDQLAVLTTSNAHLADLSRNIHALTRLLTQSNVSRALVYRDMLDTLDGDVRRHLAQASALLADLRPRGASAGTSRRGSR